MKPLTMLKANPRRRVKYLKVMEKSMLTSIGKESNNLCCRHITLDPSQKFVFGRSRHAQCMILNPKIARIHAILKFNGHNRTWNITDNKSGSGVFING